MKKVNSEAISSRSSAPILAWDFHCQYLKEIKAACADLKKVARISDQFHWNKKNLKIEERIKNEVIVVTDLNMKIVFASNEIRKMTGYKEEEVLGKTPRIFQGQGTSQSVLNEIKEAIKLEIPFNKTLDNYRKNGEHYKCNIDAIPVFNLKGVLSHFIAFEKEDKSA
jgi:PAS domain S-box-containing protein